MLVNSASYRVNLDAMRACLKAGSHYVDLGGLYWMTGDQLAHLTQIRGGRSRLGERHVDVVVQYDDEPRFPRERENAVERR